MDPTILTDQDRLQYFDQVFVEMIGGTDDYGMVIDHYNGSTYAQLAEFYGVSRSTAHSWVTSAKATMRRAGLVVPASPRRQTAKA